MPWSPARAQGTSASRAARAATPSTRAPSPTSRRFPSSPAPATTASRAAMAAAIRSSPRTPSHRPTRWLAGPRSTSSTSSRPAPSRSTPSPMCRRSRVVFDSGGNSVTLTDSLVSGSSTGVFRIGGGAGDDVVDASAVGATALTFVAGTGADKITAGSSNGNYVFADLTAADTVQGGSGIETVDFANAGAVSAADFANVTNIEGLVLNAGGSDVTLTNSLVAGTSTGFFWILGGAGSDTVDASAISNGTAVSFIAGSGADTFKGGNGRNDSVFAADELTSADTVTGGSAIDTLYFLTPGEVAATAFANVTNIEGLGLDPGGNTVTLTDS